VGWRLFNDLEQRIEALRCDHVRLIQDENLETVTSRGKNRTLAKITGVIDTVVAGRVDFDYV
jgi:hypothetical protein